LTKKAKRYEGLIGSEFDHEFFSPICSNEKKTQVMAVGKTDTKLNIWMDGGRLEQVKEFT